MDVRVKESQSHTYSGRNRPDRPIVLPVENLHFPGTNTDAIPNIAHITLKEVKIIEKSLDKCDKISMLFLLYDDAKQALDYYNEYNSNFTELWAIQEDTGINRNRFWSNKILEALCIIQNYSVLRKLCLKKADSKIRFMPYEHNTSLYINIVKKNLYITCEEMTSFQRNKFINKLKEDFKEKCIPFIRFPEKYLELYFLYCFFIKYITYKKLDNILKIFEKIGLKHISYRLSSIQNVNFNEHRSIDNMMQQDNIKNQCDTEKAMPSSKCTSNSSSNDDCYDMSHDNAGICLIINQEEFHFSQDPKKILFLPITLSEALKPRPGSNIDKRRLKETFEYFGFTTYVCNNLTEEEIIDKIKFILNKVKHTDCCFICCILSHGQADAVFGSDSIPVQISHIEDIIYDKKYINLLKKPKILIVQSCQGNQIQQALDIKEEPTINDNHIENTYEYIRKIDFNDIDGIDLAPERCDLLVCMSTISGYASIRNEREGSWYIQELCDVLRADAHRSHFTDILTKVTNRVKDRQWAKDDKILCMVPSFKSSFTKKLYLSPPVLDK